MSETGGVPEEDEYPDEYYECSEESEEREWDGPPIPPDGYYFAPAARPVPLTPALEIHCARCGLVCVIAADRERRAILQMRLWRKGWRREPTTQLDYCPSCDP